MSKTESYRKSSKTKRDIKQTHKPDYYRIKKKMKSAKTNLKNYYLVLKYKSWLQLNTFTQAYIIKIA